MGTYDGPIKNQDLLNLREYVTADTGSLNKADSTVLLMVTHSNLQAGSRFVSWDPDASRGPGRSRPVLDRHRARSEPARSS